MSSTNCNFVILILILAVRMYKSLFRTFRLTFLSFLLLQFLNGCSLDNSVSADLAQADWIRTNQREFITVWSVDDIPFIEVTLEYTGKEPDLLDSGILPDYDWKVKNTDFYNCSFRNLTDVPIELVEVYFELEKGKWRNENPQRAEHIASRWGSNSIAPHETIQRKNSWVWGKGSENTLNKTYTATITPPSKDPRLHDNFEANNNQPISFSFSCPLKFIR